VPRRMGLILALTILLTGNGLAQARGGHGGHGGHHGHHHEGQGRSFRGQALPRGTFLPPTGGLAPAAPFGSGPPPGYTYCDDPPGFYPQVLKCAHGWRRTPP
jgi:hypothetical protein